MTNPQHVNPGLDTTINRVVIDDSYRSGKMPKKGEVIQTGIIFANGDGSIQWGSHQVIRYVSSDGTPWYRPREAKVDKTSYHWRFPVETQERIIKDLKTYANPKEGKDAIKRLLAGDKP